jgi:hypothetical protein
MNANVASNGARIKVERTGLPSVRGMKVTCN